MMLKSKQEFITPYVIERDVVKNSIAKEKQLLNINFIIFVDIVEIIGGIKALRFSYPAINSKDIEDYSNNDDSITFYDNKDNRKVTTKLLTKYKNTDFYYILREIIESILSVVKCTDIIFHPDDFYDETEQKDIPVDFVNSLDMFNEKHMNKLLSQVIDVYEGYMDEFRGKNLFVQDTKNGIINHYAKYGLCCPKCLSWRVGYYYGSDILDFFCHNCSNEWVGGRDTIIEQES